MDQLFNINTQDFGVEQYILLTFALSLTLTFALFIIAVVHILTETRLSTKAKWFWLIVCFFLVLPIHIYNTIFIRQAFIRHLSWLTGIALFISAIILIAPNIMRNIENKRVEQALRSEMTDVKPIFDKNELPRPYHFMHQLIARVTVAQKLCGWQPALKLIFTSNSDKFLYKSVNHFLKKTSYSFSEAETMIQIYQEKLIDEASLAPNINKEKFCHSDKGKILELFYQRFSQTPRKVERQMGIPSK